MRKMLLALSLLLVVLNSTYSRLLYVNPVSGRNNLDGLSPVQAGTSGPKLTVKGATDIALPGDTIFLMNGYYSGSGNRSLRVNKDSIHIIGEDVAQVVIDPGPASVFIVLGADSANFMEEFSLQNLTILGAGGSSYPCNITAFYVRSGLFKNLKLIGKGNIDLYNHSSFKLFGAENMVLEQLEFRSHGRYGLEMGAVQNISLTDLVFDSIGDISADAAIQIWTGAGNTFPGGPTDGVYLNGNIQFGSCVNGIITETVNDSIFNLSTGSASLQTSGLGSAVFGYSGNQDPFINTSAFAAVPLAYRLSYGGSIPAAAYFTELVNVLDHANDNQIVDSSMVEFVSNGSRTGIYHVADSMNPALPFLTGAAEVILHPGDYSTDRIVVSSPALLRILNSSENIGSLRLQSNLTVDGQLRISDSLVLNTGLLDYNNASGLVTMSSQSDVIGGSNVSYVNGPLKIEANAAPRSFRFPIGSSGRFSLAELQVNQSAGSYSVEGEWASIQAPVFVLPSTLREVKPYPGFWRLNYGPGGSFFSAELTLHYQPQDTVTDPAELRIAGSSNGNSWSDFGGSGTALWTGSITTTVNLTSSDLGIFTLANSLTGNNFKSLPMAAGDVLDDPAMQVYPNPASSCGILNVNSAKVIAMHLTDHNGKIVPLNFIPGEEKVRLPDLSAGLYFLHLFTELEVITTKLLIE